MQVYIILHSNKWSLTKENPYDLTWAFCIDGQFPIFKKQSLNTQKVKTRFDKPSCDEEVHIPIYTSQTHNYSYIHTFYSGLICKEIAQTKQHPGIEFLLHEHGHVAVILKGKIFANRVR